MEFVRFSELKSKRGDEDEGPGTKNRRRLVVLVGTCESLNTNGTSWRHHRGTEGTASKARGWQSSHKQMGCP